MFEKIKLYKDELIVFIGSMNAMPMMYAWELKKIGYDVLYFVDAPASDTLARPENHFPDITYPYPEWIVELKLPTQMILPYLPRFFAAYIANKIRKLKKNKISCFVLNGFFISLAPSLIRVAKVVALSHGSDLDVWASKENSENLAATFRRRSIFKFLPDFVASRLINLAVSRQYDGFASSSAVVYFPEGFNATGDAVTQDLEKAGVHILRRYDVSFEPLKNASREFKEPQEKLVIFSGVRFLYKTFPDGNAGYSKGNNIIIKGLSKYYKLNKNIEVHFVEKGEDVAEAKILCEELGLSEAIIWHKEMPFKKLISLCENSDICFDQVGEHWIGAIGFYALSLGKPLIANDRRAVDAGVWDDDAPIFSARTSEQIEKHLIYLESGEDRAKISRKAMKFADSALGPKSVLRNLFECKPVDAAF